MESITPRLQKLLEIQLGLDSGQAQLESKIKFELGADSLDTVEIVMALEEEFDIEIADEEFEDKEDMTVSELAALISEKLSKK